MALKEAVPSGRAAMHLRCQGRESHAAGGPATRARASPEISEHATSFLFVPAPTVVHNEEGTSKGSTRYMESRRLRVACHVLEQGLAYVGRSGEPRDGAAAAVTRTRASLEISEHATPCL